MAFPAQTLTSKKNFGRHKDGFCICILYKDGFCLKKAYAVLGVYDFAGLEEVEEVEEIE
jgi:hypothetical protein